MPCPQRKCPCESPALRLTLQLPVPPGSGGFLYGPCECACHFVLAGQLEVLNSTEALFGFVAWLSTRSLALKVGAKQDPGALATLLNEYVRVNQLPDTRPDWEERIRTPVEEEA